MFLHFRFRALVLLSAALAGCAGPQGPAPRHRPAKVTTAPTPAAAPLPVASPRIATPDDVRDCKLVSRLGSLGPRLGESVADSEVRTRSEVMSKATELRATHLVWGEAQFSYAPASSIAGAYRCGR